MLASSVLSLCRPRFQAGQLLIAPGVHDLVEDRKLDLMSYLARHLRGDWGDVSEADRRANIAALRQGCQLLSSYEFAPGQKLRIITDAHRQFTTAILSPTAPFYSKGARQ